MARLVGAVAISPWAARILVARGITEPEAADSFLHPESHPFHDPALLPDINPFLSRIEAAISRRHRVVIHGDYDADGITSAAILKFAFERVGLSPEVYLPNRMESGYGIRADWIEAKKAEGFDLIVTTDCGSRAVEACARAAELGIDLILTDHHQPEEDLKGPLAHINPHLSRSRYPFQHLSGAGVAFKLAQALLPLVPPSFQEAYRRELPIDLAMIGTVADVMPLIGENRRIVVDGLDRLRANPSPGVRALLDSARCAPEGATLETIGFQVGPRLNAAGRLRSPRLAFDLLVSQDPKQLADLSAELEKANEERKKLGAVATASALERLRANPPTGAVVLADPEWHRGILGIVAAKLMEATGLPVFVASIEGDLAHGSARAPSGFDAGQMLESVSDLTVAGGGHAGAAGFTVEMSRWGDFEKALRHVASEFDGQAVAPELLIDAFLESEHPVEAILREVPVLEPFGQGFPAPVFSLCRFEGRGRYTLFGEGHLRINLGTPARPLEAVGFRLAEWAKDLDHGPVDLAIEYGENHWNGRTVIRPRIVAIRPSLRETLEPSLPEEVSRVELGGGIPGVVVWDGRGGAALDLEGCLRVGYGPEWRVWWRESSPGELPFWKNRIWERSSALPVGAWPGSCSTGYGGEIPPEWDGRIVDILWPPIRKMDRAWLRSVLTSTGRGTLVRLAYGAEALEAWLSGMHAEATRENTAVVYRQLEQPTPLKELLQLPLSTATLGVCLEALVDLGLVECDEEVARRATATAKRELSASAFLRRWEVYTEKLKTWSDTALRRPAAELVRMWLRGDPAGPKR
ncbi:MAG: hypothetical protein GHCLOJNM_01933 [bacterium]|nr:hypothetical protein [bacterium]